VNATHGLDKVKVFRALGDETRLAMVRIFGCGREMPCSSLVQACRTTRTAASYHYKELEQRGSSPVGAKVSLSRSSLT